MKRAILARHAESERSVLGLTNGDPHVVVHLTETGREEARALGRALSDERIDLCVTSEFARAHETADEALRGRNVPRLAVPELNDIRFGEYEGRPLADYRAWARSHGPSELVPGGGESRAETIARYVRGFRTVLERPEETILVVSHGLPVRYALEAAEGRHPAPAVRNVPYATPFPLDAEQLEAALERLESWLERPSWASGTVASDATIQPGHSGRAGGVMRRRQG